MPDELTWFKWEAYTTWISGFFLLVVLYYFGAELYLIDPLTFATCRSGMAIAISLGGLVARLDRLRRAVQVAARRAATAGLSAAGFVFLVALAWLCTLLFSGRGAYMQMGALIGTIMVANVFLVIIPNQKKVVADLMAGQRARSDARRAGQAALDAQQLSDAAGAVPDDQQPLSDEPSRAAGTG